MKGFTYILECADRSLYTGSTINLENRLKEHQSGIGANFTRKRLPVRLVYYEEHAQIEMAFFREKQIQGWSRTKKLALIKDDLSKLSNLSECKNRTNAKCREGVKR